MYGQIESQACGNSVAPAQDKREIARALDDLRNVVERYDCLVGRMGDKLIPITITAPPVSTGKEEIGYQTGLASAIDDIRIKIRNITDDLESIYERIEL